MSFVVSEPWPGGHGPWSSAVPASPTSSGHSSRCFPAGEECPPPSSHGGCQAGLSHLPPVQELEGGEPGGCLRYFSVGEKQIGEPLIPVSSRVRHKFSQHGLQGLIEPLNQAVSLRMLGCGFDTPDP